MDRIQVFEWEKLKVGQNLPGLKGYSFTQIQFESLVQWQESQKKDFFRVGNKSITFVQWVGVIQVKGLCIEVLPKADKRSITAENRESILNEWKPVLMIMLKRTGALKLRTTQETSLSSSKQSLLDLYFQSFLNEVESLLHQGLIKKYQRESKNRTALKGKLNFSKQVQQNLVHKERFYTEAAEYTRQNIYNEILLEAIRITSVKAQSGLMRSKAKELELSFPDWPKQRINESKFDKLSFDRKSEPYKPSLSLAKLIVLELNPQLQAGSENVMAIFFDMNELFERYVAYELRKVIPSEFELLTQRPQMDLLVKADNTSLFKMKPDITIRKVKTHEIVAVYDTKWKSLDAVDKKLGVSQSDLYQMYTYAEAYECNTISLIYPDWSTSKTKAENHQYEYQTRGQFRKNHGNQKPKLLKLFPFDAKSFVTIGGLSEREKFFKYILEF